jgi:hypothetical protein
MKSRNKQLLPGGLLIVGDDCDTYSAPASLIAGCSDSGHASVAALPRYETTVAIGEMHYTTSTECGTDSDLEIAPARFKNPAAFRLGRDVRQYIALDPGNSELLVEWSDLGLKPDRSLQNQTVICIQSQVPWSTRASGGQAERVFLYCV